MPPDESPESAGERLEGRCPVAEVPQANSMGSAGAPRAYAGQLVSNKNQREHVCRDMAPDDSTESAGTFLPHQEPMIGVDGPSRAENSFSVML